MEMCMLLTRAPTNSTEANSTVNQIVDSLWHQFTLESLGAIGSDVIPHLYVMHQVGHYYYWIINGVGEQVVESFV